MDIISIHQAINKSIINVMKATNVLTPVENEKHEDYIRAEENPFVLTESVNRTKDCAKAHVLHQYRRRFYSIRLEQQSHNWLDCLLEIDKKGDK